MVTSSTSHSACNTPAVTGRNSPAFADDSSASASSACLASTPVNDKPVHYPKKVSWVEVSGRTERCLSQALWWICYRHTSCNCCKHVTALYCLMWLVSLIDWWCWVSDEFLWGIFTQSWNNIQLALVLLAVICLLHVINVSPSYLHLATSEMWCWSGGRVILRKLGNGRCLMPDVLWKNVSATTLLVGSSDTWNHLWNVM